MKMKIPLLAGFFCLCFC